MCLYLASPLPAGVPAQPPEQDELLQPGLCVRGQSAAAAGRPAASGAPGPDRSSELSNTFFIYNKPLLRTLNLKKMEGLQVHLRFPQREVILIVVVEEVLFLQLLQ